MSEHEPVFPYVYQPYGSVTHLDRNALGRLFGVGGVHVLATITGLTRAEAEAVARIPELRERCALADAGVETVLISTERHKQLLKAEDDNVELLAACENFIREWGDGDYTSDSEVPLSSMEEEFSLMRAAIAKANLSMQNSDTV